MATVERLLNALSRSVDDYVVALDSMGTIVFADEDVLRFLGRSQAEVGTLNIGELLPGPELAWLARVVGRMFADAPVTMPQEIRAKGAGGAVAEFLLTAWRFNRPGGEVLVIAVLREKRGGCARPAS